MAEIIYVHKQATNGSPGEPQPCSDLQHAHRQGYVKCADQVAAAAAYKAKQGAAAEAAPEAPPAPPAPVQGVTSTSNAAKPGGSFPCPFDPTHGPFASANGLRGHINAKHAGQVAPEAPPAEKQPTI